MTSKCSFIKPDQSSCKRMGSQKSGHDPRKCWQHQTIKLTKAVIVPPVTSVNPYNSTVKSNLNHRFPVSPLYQTVIGISRYRCGTRLGELDVLGQRDLDVAYRTTDPDADEIFNKVKTNYLDRVDFIDCLQESCLSLESYKESDHFKFSEFRNERRLDFTQINQQCRSPYRRSPVSYDPLETIPVDHIVIMDLEYPSRCMIVTDYITSWTYNLTVLDVNTRRIKPQYPRDIITNEIMLPTDIYTILYRALEIGIIQPCDRDPLWYILKDNMLLTDLYNFIKFKSALENAYDVFPDSDLGAWNRRDLILIHQLRSIYERNQIEPHGWRYYTNIPSARQATMVFESCVLVGKLIQAFNLKLDPGSETEYSWKFTLDEDKCHDLICERDPARCGVMSDIVTLNDTNVFLF